MTQGRTSINRDSSSSPCSATRCCEACGTPRELHTAATAACWGSKQLAAALKQLQEVLPTIKAAAVGAAGGPPAVPGPLAPLVGQLSPLTALTPHCKPDSCPWPLPEHLPASQTEGLLQQQPMSLIAPGVTPAVQLGVSGPGGTSLNGWAMPGTTAAAAAAGMSSCRKCDSMKPLLALLQKVRQGQPAGWDWWRGGGLLAMQASLRLVLWTELTAGLSLTSSVEHD